MIKPEGQQTIDSKDKIKQVTKKYLFF